jgi:hypothetical protein
MRSGIQVFDLRQQVKDDGGKHHCGCEFHGGSPGRAGVALCD